MKTIVIYFVLLLSMSAFAEEKESVTKENAITASKEYRQAVKIISIIHSESLQKLLPQELEAKTEFSEKQINDYKKARKHLEKAITLNPFLSDAYVFLANSYWELENDLSRTVSYYSKAIEVDPHFDGVISARGHVYTLIGDHANAQKDLKRLKEINSDFAASLEEDISKMK